LLRALIGDTTMRSHNDASCARKRDAGDCQYRKSACATGVFVIRAFDDLGAVDVIATDRSRPKPRCADSESRFLAMKKFSWLPASSVIAARQNRFFARIACG
jgi:hypothetical protein